MENITPNITDANKFGIQGILVLNLGSVIEEHRMIPELLTPEEYEAKIEKYLEYGTYEKIELECVDSYGVPYTILVNQNLLNGSYFKFVRVNIQNVN